MYSWTKQEQASSHPSNLSIYKIFKFNVFGALSGNGGIPADVKT